MIKCKHIHQKVKRWPVTLKFDVVIQFYNINQVIGVNFTYDIEKYKYIVYWMKLKENVLEGSQIYKIVINV